jgi:hypothetical protein
VEVGFVQKGVPRTALGRGAGTFFQRRLSDPSTTAA